MMVKKSLATSSLKDTKAIKKFFKNLQKSYMELFNRKVSQSVFINIPVILRPIETIQNPNLLKK